MYRLTYWNKRGRAEQVRLLLHELGEPFVNVHVTADSPEFRELQRSRTLMFGSVPLLEDGSYRLCQGPVILSYLARKHGIAPASLQDAARADAITLGAEDLRIRYFGLFGPEGPARQKRFVEGAWRERWLPSFEGLLQDSGTGFFGPSLTHADVAVFDAVDATLTWVEGATLGDAPRLAAFMESMRARPRLAAYLRSPDRPQG